MAGAMCERRNAKSSDMDTPPAMWQTSVTQFILNYIEMRDHKGDNRRLTAEVVIALFKNAVNGHKIRLVAILSG